MSKFHFHLTGISPILQHCDDVLLQDKLNAWRKNPSNKANSTAGDDRSPGWTWKTYLYTNLHSPDPNVANGAAVVSVPTHALMASLRVAGAKIIVKRSETLKRYTQSGLFIEQQFLPLKVDGKYIKYDDINAIPDDDPFADQLKVVNELGFDIDVRRVPVGTSKHVRTRPIFHKWELEGDIMVNADEITKDRLEKCFELAGHIAGLLDWRPSAPKTPGPYGRFDCELKMLEK